MRLERLLSIILILSNKKIITGKELSEHFEVSLRTIYRDIEKISSAGIPISAIGGKNGGFSMMDTFNVKNYFLNNNESLFLGSLLENLSVIFGRNNYFNEIILKQKSILNKKNNSEEKSLKIDLSHFNIENSLKKYFKIINEAIEECRYLSFDYTNRNLKEEKRLVEAIQISFENGNWYLISYCLDRKEYRKFKFLRMRNLEIKEKFLKNFHNLDMIKEIFTRKYIEKSIKVELLFSKEIGNHLKEFFPEEKIAQQNDGNFLVKEFFPYEEGLIKFILGFGKNCKILKPDYLIKDFRKYLKKIEENYF
jgi:predicted DNA-binding transcriptional regulator YafY